MAKKVETIVTLTDDLDGSKADRTISFAFDGSNYEIDLSKRNANAFEKALSPYLSAARNASRRRGPAPRSARRRSSGSKGRDLKAVRDWARENGHPVSDRGRIPSPVLEAYDTAHA